MLVLKWQQTLTKISMLPPMSKYAIQNGHLQKMKVVTLDKTF